MTDCLKNPPKVKFDYTVIYVENRTGEVKDAFGTDTYDEKGGTVALKEGCHWEDTNQPIETTVSQIGSIPHLSGTYNPRCRWVLTSRGWVCIPC